METALDFKNFSPNVLQVIPRNDYKVYIYFNDGSVRLYDVKPLIQKDTVFEPLFDIETFKSKITVIGGSLSWDFKGDRNPYECIDLDSVEIFKTAQIVPDPLSKGSLDG